MSHYDYKASQRISAEDYPFYALIMAAMRQADTRNLAKLEDAFPDIHKELFERYNLPGGLYPEEWKIKEEIYDGLLTSREQEGDKDEYGIPVDSVMEQDSHQEDNSSSRSAEPMTESAQLIEDSCLLLMRDIATGKLEVGEFYQADFGVAVRVIDRLRAALAEKEKEGDPIRVGGLVNVVMNSLWNKAAYTTASKVELTDAIREAGIRISRIMAGELP